MYINSNPRYRHFCQTYFTAGDEEQFDDNRTHTALDTHIPLYTPIPTLDVWHGYTNATSEVVTNTFRYLFNKFKKGIFISVRNNKVETFLPFSKVKFINEWGDRIKVDPKFASFTDFIGHICSLENRKFSEHRVNRFTNHWYGNNCLVRYEFPLSENDTGVHHIKSMFEELCETESIPDIDFFVNRRDFPLLKRDGTEPYNHMWDSENKPLVSHKYDSYLPILSSTTTDKFADIAIPTLEDWARVKFLEGVSFPKTDKRDYTIPQSVDEWNMKKDIAVFRGASTGAGTTIETNPRLKVASLTKGHEDMIDAGITDWNLRPRKYQGSPYLSTIEIKDLPFGLVQKLTPMEQSGYKYIIHIDGHVSAFRLSLEMALGSVILKVGSEYKLWYSDMLKPYVHYVPVSKNLDDLFEKIKWCRENPLECLKIVKNARLFYDTYLSKKGILSHLKSVLCGVKAVTGTYKISINPIDLQYVYELENLKHLSLVDVKKQIASTKLTTIFLSNDNKCVVKKTDDMKKKKENVHEAYIGTNVLNREVRTNPNFIRTYGIDESQSVISDLVQGTTMFSWFTDKNFSMFEFIKVLVHICLGLHQAQLSFDFVHNDLFPWNVIINQKKNRESYTYVVDKDKAVTISTTSVPVIIDYGKSHVMYQNKHFGFINKDVFNPIIDVLSILFSSLNVVIKNNCFSKKDDEDVLYLLNFISGTQFRPQKFCSFKEVRQFIFDNASFSSLITLDVKDLAQKTPFDFCLYILKKFPDMFLIREKIESKSLKKKLLPKHIKIIGEKNIKNTLLVYYFFQQLSLTFECSDVLFELFKEKLKTSISAPVSKKVEYSTRLYSGVFNLPP